MTSATLQLKNQFTLVDDSRLQVKVPIPERIFALYSSSLSLEEVNELANPTVSLSVLPDQTFEASCTKAPWFPMKPRTIEATFLFQRPAEIAITAGMTAGFPLLIRTTSLASPCHCRR